MRRFDDEFEYQEEKKKKKNKTRPRKVVCPVCMGNCYIGEFICLCCGGKGEIDSENKSI